MQDPLSSLLTIPWTPGGRDHTGCDCLGIVLLYGKLQGVDIEVATPRQQPAAVDAIRHLLNGWVPPRGADLRKYQGEPVVVFMQQVKGRGQGCCVHVGVLVPGKGLLHTSYGGTRIDNNLELMRRVGLEAVGTIPLADAASVGEALAKSGVAGPAAIILGVIAVVSIGLSVLLMPKAPKYGATTGRYGFDSLATTNTGEIPVPDILGSIWTPGNVIFQELSDKTQAVDHPEQQGATRLVALCEDLPASANIDWANYNLRINGYGYDSSFLYSNTGTTGIYPNPAQTKAEAITGTIASKTYRPSFTPYYDNSTGINGKITTKIDIAASYIREYPVWGFRSLSYITFRLFNSAIYSSFDLQVYVQGRNCRTFNSSGFIRTTYTSTYSGGVTRSWLSLLKDTYFDSITFGGNTYYPASPTNIGGYYASPYFGYIQMDAGTTIPASTTVTLNGGYYFTRSSTTNPAAHLVYLLTEKVFGKGLPESKIDWPSFDAAQTYFAQNVYTTTDKGTFVGPRYTTNYILDRRATIQEHIKAILDACNCALVISDGKVKIKTLQYGTSVFSFTAGNIIADSFTATLLDKADRPNRLNVTYHESTSFSAEVNLVTDDTVDQAARAGYTGNDGVIESQLKLAAVDNQAQAQRIAARLLTELSQTQWTIKFTTTILGLPLEPGDIIDVTHPSQPAWNGKLFIIDSIDHDPDDRLLIEASEIQPRPYP